MGMKLFGGAVVVATALLSASAALASTLRYQSGFEPSEGFSIGNLIGQHGWEQADGAPPAVDSLVQNGVVRPVSGGLQAVQLRTNGPSVDPNANFTDVWTVASGVTPAQTALEPLVTIQWDMMRGPITGSQSPTALWGIDIYDSGASNIAASIGAYDDDLGPAIAATDAGGNFVFLGDGSARGTWDSYSVTINYLTRKYTVSLNGVQLGAAQSLYFGANNGINDVDFLALTRGKDSAYFDNLSVTTSAVPEPAAIGIVALAGIGLLRKRR